jgi:hypothetical protein
MTQLPLIDTDGHTILPGLRQDTAEAAGQHVEPVRQHVDAWTAHAVEFMAGGQQ